MHGCIAVAGIAANLNDVGRYGDLNKADEKSTIYMVTGGGLETAGPIKPYFQNNVKHGHHYCQVGINGGTLEFKAFDLEGRLFDYLKIDKSTPVPSVEPNETAAK